MKDILYRYDVDIDMVPVHTSHIESYDMVYDNYNMGTTYPIIVQYTQHMAWLQCRSQSRAGDIERCQESQQRPVGCHALPRALPRVSPVEPIVDSWHM